MTTRTLTSFDLALHRAIWYWRVATIWQPDLVLISPSTGQSGITVYTVSDLMALF